MHLVFVEQVPFFSLSTNCLHIQIMLFFYYAKNFLKFSFRHFPTNQPIKQKNQPTNKQTNKQTNTQSRKFKIDREDEGCGKSQKS